MALFKKEICPVCGNVAKGLPMVKIKGNQRLCSNCTIRVDMTPAMMPFQTVENIKEHFAYREENMKIFQNFSPTKGIKCGDLYYLREDENMRKWYCSVHEEPKNPQLFEYDEIIDYVLTENGEQIAKGGVGAAVTGGVMFGGVGAIVGSNVGKKKTQTIVNDICLNVSLKHKYIQRLEIHFIPGGRTVKAGDILYNAYKNTANEAVAFFDNLCSKAKAASISLNQSAVTSSADEILKFKNLLDAGIITQEEFEAKKKELLGL